MKFAQIPDEPDGMYVPAPHDVQFVAGLKSASVVPARHENVEHAPDELEGTYVPVEHVMHGVAELLS